MYHRSPPFESWVEIFGSERLTGALLDRLTHRVHILEADLTSLRPADIGGEVDIIVSNPPYVSAEEMALLPEEFGFEPAPALEAGEAGMAIVIRILKQAADYLSEHGILVIEVGYSRPALEQRLRECEAPEE